jgi:GTP-binding protein LepA
MHQKNLRNFCIVAHIDHGKSTIADRLIELTGTLERRRMRAQVLDTMDLERERGITIKLNAVRMVHRTAGTEYELCLIDTPGHVDFTYEVSRSLNACEGALLVVDASQGVQAQTVSNLLLALEAGLEIIPVLNKIDLPAAEPERRSEELQELLGVSDADIVRVSAKEGTGMQRLLDAIVARVPPPTGDPEAPLRALIFDTYYDRYRGAIPSIRVVDGRLARGSTICFGSHPDDSYEVVEVGFMQLDQRRADELQAGEVGYFVANVRGVRETRVGDTVLDAERPASTMLPGYREARPMVFAGLYPTDSNQYEELRDALEKLQLNDASLHYEPESSVALGFGFRCGFLGLLHMDIVQERLEREFDLDLVTTVPNVQYRVHMTDGTMQVVENPSKMATGSKVDHVKEPYVKTHITTPTEYIGSVMKLGQERRGDYLGMKYLDTVRVQLEWDFPLAEILIDFYDRLKTVSRGYAGMDYEFADYRQRQGARLGTQDGGQVERLDSASAVRSRHSGVGWNESDRAPDGQAAQKERHRQVLWRGRDAQAQIA